MRGKEGEERRLPAGGNSDAERSNDFARNRVESVRGKASGREEGRRRKGWRKFDLSEGGEGRREGGWTGSRDCALISSDTDHRLQLPFRPPLSRRDLSTPPTLGCLFLGEDWQAPRAGMQPSDSICRNKIRTGVLSDSANFSLPPSSFSLLSLVLSRSCSSFMEKCTSTIRSVCNRRLDLSIIDLINLNLVT